MIAWPDWKWDLIPPAPEPAHLQMALDEVLLGRVASGRRPPTLRFWEWSEPALVIGSHQSVRNEVDRRQAARRGFQVTRRMSGGGTMLVEPGRTITYALYAPVELVAALSFVDSFRFLDRWAVEGLRALGVEASYRPINDIVSPFGKIGGAAQARRRGTLLHHTTMAYALDRDLLLQLIRIGRPRRSRQGLRSADKIVSPLAELTSRSRGEVIEQLARRFSAERETRTGAISRSERAEAERLVEEKYGRAEWIFRLP